VESPALGPAPTPVPGTLPAAGRVVGRVPSRVFSPVSIPVTDRAAPPPAQNARVTKRATVSYLPGLGVRRPGTQSLDDMPPAAGCAWVPGVLCTEPYRQVTAHSPTGMHGLKLAFEDAGLPAFAPHCRL
jgi:hypothetical protein